MSHNHRQIFAEDSDEDSIDTDSTAASEEHESYNVEKVLAEDANHRDHNGKVHFHYLLKWAGYPLSRATWEPPTNIDDEILIDEWKREKQRIREGKSKPFNVALYEEALTEQLHAQAERQRRRREKRRKRGESVPSEPDEVEEESDAEEGSSRRRLRRKGAADSEDDDVVEAAKPPRVKRVKTTPVKRKGIAQKISSSRRVIQSESEDGEASSDSHGGRGSEPDSLFDQGSQPIYPDSSAPEIAPARRQKAPITKPKASVARPTSAAKPAKPSNVSVAARKSAPVPPVTYKPTTMTARRTVKPPTNIFRKFGDQNVQKRQRARVNGETPKDSTDPKFKILSQQRRMQNYSRNEPTPNLNDLTMIDPKTGRAQPAKSIIAPRPALAPISVPASTARAPREIHSAYSARTPPRERHRSRTPPAPEPRSGPAGAVQAQMQPAPIQARVPSYRRTVTCWDWMNGNTCRRTDETCDYAHYVVDTPPQQQAPPMGPRPPPTPTGLGAKKYVTCYFWHNRGRCNKSDEFCEFAHHDTGVYSLRAQQQPSLPQRPPQHLEICRYWPNCRYSASECLRWHPDVATTSPATGGAGTMGSGLQSYSSPVATMQPAYLTGANAEHAGGLALRSTRIPAAQDGATSATTDRGDRSVRFQPPLADESVPYQPIANDQGSQAVRLTVTTDHSGQAVYMDATLHMTGLRKFERLLSTVNRGINLFADRMVTAKDLQELHADAIAVRSMWPAGSVEPRTGCTVVADKLAECCKLHASGLISVRDGYTLLIYPSNSEEWRFLDTPVQSIGPTTSLRFHMFRPLAGFVRLNSAPTFSEQVTLEQPASVLTIGTLLGLNMGSILQRPLDQRAVEQNMFILWPPNRVHELEMLAQYFQAMKCKVYHSSTPGAWMRFKAKHGKGAVVILYPDIPFWEMPGLFKLFISSDAKFFSLDINASTATTESGQCTTSRRLLFPHGKVFFITDDVIVYHPEKAINVLDQYLALNKDKPLGGENDRIVTRPGIKDWLLKLVDESITERGHPDTRWIQLYEKICAICPPAAEDPWDPPNPLPSANLISVPADTLPSFAGLWERDEVAATNMMVEWFAGWCVMNAESFRRFYVCYEPKGGESVLDENGRYKVVSDPRGWSKKFNHLAVQRPDEITKNAKKVGK